MDEQYLHDLIQEAKSRGGGLVLNSEEKPEAVVLTVDRYNEILLNSSQMKALASDRPAAEPLLEDSPKQVLVTGGAGYIGAHVCLELKKMGYEVLVIDNLSTGKVENIPEQVKFYEGDLADGNFLRDVFAQNSVFAVIHMAASIEVEESVREPEMYLQNNALNTLQLLTIMNEFGVKQIVFSSTAAVYGEQETGPIKESAPLRPNNPYGYSKLLAEKIIKYYCKFSGFSAVIFRYLNACGYDRHKRVLPTHESHLLPIVSEVALGKRPCLKVFGTDYPTHDGTAVRDYVHVSDIAASHVRALGGFPQPGETGVYNVGTGKGLSVLEIVNKFSEITGRVVPMEMADRRAGDSAFLVADNTKLKEYLNFELENSTPENIIESIWRQSGIS